MDRIDLHIEVDNISYDDLTDKISNEETSASIKERVNKARRIQLERFNGAGQFCNAHMTTKECNTFCKLDEECENLLKVAFEKLNLSARAYNRILKVARTIADLDASEKIKPQHIAEAISYRTLDKKYWNY